MKLKVISKENKENGSVELPSQFNEPIRKDLVKRAVLVIQSNNRQAYGASPEAGLRHSTRVSKRRRDYRGCYGQGISRVPRKITSRRGTRMNWVGAEAPGTVGGRRAHPPKAEKKWDKKINDKERKKAIRSALSAVVLKNIVSERGHKLPENYPFILDDDFEKLKKSKEVITALSNLGFKEELDRASTNKVRAGRGKSRARKYKTKSSILFIVKDDCELLKSAKNIKGAQIVKVNQLNTELLAPGADIGRVSLFSKGAIEKLEKEKLFM